MSKPDRGFSTTAESSRFPIKGIGPAVGAHPWHSLYLFYLLAYFAAMISLILRAALKRTVVSGVHAAFLTGAVGVNIGVWLLEQLVHIEFEFLSVSYSISELFLLGLCLMVQEQERLQQKSAEVTVPEIS